MQEPKCHLGHKNSFI